MMEEIDESLEGDVTFLDHPRQADVAEGRVLIEKRTHDLLRM